MKTKKKLHVVLNGTDTNPYHAMGFKQNPFPQLAKAEWDRHCLTVQRLGGDPIPNTDYIKGVLEGFSPEFVELCCSQFRPGKQVEFDVFWEEEDV